MTTTTRQPIKYWPGFFIAFFLILGLGYSTLTPLFENSDETLHYPYVKHLADGRGLPLAIPGQLWGQEGTQPPLYYAIVAASTFWIDSDNLSEPMQRNPHWLFTEVRALINDNQNLVLPGPAETFPYRRAALAIHIGRWWSLAFGLLTVIGAYFLVRHLFPDNFPLALTTTALTAFNPQFIRVSATVSNDSLAAALTTLTVLLALKCTGQNNTTRRASTHGVLHVSTLLPVRYALLLGALTGLALLIKLSALPAVFLVSLIVFWRSLLLSKENRISWLEVIRWLTVFGATLAVLTGWWFFRNYQLYGEWLATETHLNLAGRSDFSLDQVWGLRNEAERAYWATFGWGQIRPPEWVYRLLFLITRVGLIGLTVAVFARFILDRISQPLPLNLQNINFAKICLLALWAGLNLALYLRWVMEVGSVSHTRLIFPAIAAISLLLGLGWHALLPRRLAAWFSGLVIVLLLTLNLYSLGWFIYPAFTPSPLLNQSMDTAGALVDLTFLGSFKLSASRVYAQNPDPATSDSNRQATQGDTVLVEAVWQTLAPMAKNYSVAVVLSAPDGSVLARRETYPGLGLRPTNTLHPGDKFRDVYPLKLTRRVAIPLVARAMINLFDVTSDSRTGIPALDAVGNEVTPAVGQIKIVPNPWPQYRPAHPVSVNFAGSIALIGYDLKPLPSTRRGLESLTLYWKSLAPVTQDYTLFLHLLDANGNLIAQADAPPMNNVYPTRWWAPGEIIADTHVLPPISEIATLRLGLYDLNSGQRLVITESTLPGDDNSVEISPW